MSRPLRVLADDLTGAADAGAGLARAGLAPRLVLDPTDAAWLHHPVAVLDTDTRAATPRRAHRLLARAAATLSGAEQVFKKVDSALRGQVGAELAALREQLDTRLVVVAPAFPATGRVTRGGVQYVRGRPLADSDIWAAEARAAPDSVLAALDDRSRAQGVAIDLRMVRLGVEPLAGALAELGAGVAVCDARTEDDLRTIAASGLRLRRPVLWVGSAGLATALGELLAASNRGGGAQEAETLGQGAACTGAGDAGARPPFLAVVGSPLPLARRQVDALVAQGASRVEVPLEVLVDPEAVASRAEFARLVGSGGARRDTVLTVLGEFQARYRELLPLRLAEVSAAAARSAGLLLLTGGATARAVLHAAGVRALELLGELEPGCALSRIPGSGGYVITKSGSFGDDQTLVRLVAAATGPGGAG